MYSLCPYKNLLGEPNRKFRKIRIFDISVIDVAVVIVVSYVISIYIKYSFLITLVIVFLSGIIIHRIFCVKTTIDKWVFGEDKKSKNLSSSPEFLGSVPSATPIRLQTL